MYKLISSENNGCDGMEGKEKLGCENKSKNKWGKTMMRPID